MAAFLLAFAAWADVDDGQTKALMHAFVVEYAKLAPYVTSEADFTSKEGRAVVSESLKNLQAKIKRKAPSALKQAPGFRISYTLLADHIAKTQQAYELGEYEYARMRVNGIGNLCAGCHLQAPGLSHFKAFEYVVERGKNVSFDNAHFLFTIRRYDEAMGMLNKLIRGYPDSGLAADRLPDAYREKLAILARVDRDPVEGIESLQEDLKNKKLPVDIRRNVGSWVEALQSWRKEKADPSKLKTPELLAYISKNLPPALDRKVAPSDPQLVLLLRYAGLLYDRLYSEPEGPHTQELLYNLARCERSLSPHYWYSVNEVYLKECVVQYPKKAFTKQCYEAYADGMRERYFGKPMPEGVQRSLDALKDYL